MRWNQVILLSVAFQRMLYSVLRKTEKLAGRVGSPGLGYVLLGLE